MHRKLFEDLILQGIDPHTAYLAAYQIKKICDRELEDWQVEGVLEKLSSMRVGDGDISKFFFERTYFENIQTGRDIGTTGNYTSGNFTAFELYVSSNPTSEQFWGAINAFVMTYASIVLVAMQYYAISVAVGLTNPNIDYGALPGANLQNLCLNDVNQNGFLFKLDLQLFAKKDLKMVNDAANEVGVDRNAFGEYIHEVKYALGMKASENFTYQELLEMAEELKNFMGK